jgi:hypothetical protein
MNVEGCVNPQPFALERYRRSGREILNVPLCEWEKIPRLQAKTLIYIMMPDPSALRAAL